MVVSCVLIAGALPESSTVSSTEKSPSKPFIALTATAAPAPALTTQPIDDALTADRDKRDIGEDLEVAFALGVRKHLAVLQRLAHQLRLDVRAAIVGDELGHWILDREDSAEKT